MHQTHKMLKSMLREQTCLFEKAEAFQILFLWKHQTPNLFFFFFSLLRVYSLLLNKTPLGAPLIGKVMKELVVRCVTWRTESKDLCKVLLKICWNLKRAFVGCKVGFFSVSWCCNIVCLWSARGIFMLCSRGLDIFFLST